MTQMEVEKKLAEVTADYVIKRNKTNNAIEDVRREMRTLECDYHNAIRECKNRIANLTEILNQHKEDLAVAKNIIFQKYEEE